MLKAALYLLFISIDMNNFQLNRSLQLGGRIFTLDIEEKKPHCNCWKKPASYRN
jgi:hypothetical protein